MKKEECSNCKFGMGIKSKIICRFNPPYVIPMQGINPITQQLEMGHMSVYPEVLRDNWCGRYKSTLTLEGGK